MLIKNLRVGKVRVPLKKPFKTALRTVHYSEDIVVWLETDSGLRGVGSAPPTAVLTGETQETIAAVMRSHLFPAIVGKEIDNLSVLLQGISQSILHNNSAKAALEMAVLDLFTRRHNLSLLTYLGGFQKKITTDLTISLNSPAEMARDAEQAVATGYTELKVKVGSHGKLDLERVKEVQRTVGKDIKLRIDANQAWSAKEAVRIISTLEDQGLEMELVEQPVAAHDIEGMVYVTKHVATDILADESAFSARDVLQLLQKRGADLISIKLMKSAGIMEALKIAQLAETFGVECMMSCMLEGKIGITAAACVAAATKNITRYDLDAASLLAEDPVVGGATFVGNEIHLSTSPGLGIEDVKGWQEI